MCSFLDLVGWARIFVFALFFSKVLFFCLKGQSLSSLLSVHSYTGLLTRSVVK